MQLDRRNFLVSAGASLAAGALSASATSFSPNPVSPVNWAVVRREFDSLSTEYIHLSSFFLVSHPRSVREAIETHRRAIDENPLVYLEQNLYDMPGKIQAAAAEYLGGKPDEVALTNSTTMGLAHVYQGIDLKAGHEVLTTEHDHFVHHEAARLAAERAGATMRKIALFDDIKHISVHDIVARIQRSINPKTRILGVTWVHSSTGLKLPVRAIADAVAVANKGRAESDRVILVVDGVHGFGVEDENAAQMGADFFIAGTHKWIFGPRGTGIIWAKAENWKMIRPVFPGFTMETLKAWLTNTKLTTPMQASRIGQGGFHAFEYEWALPAAFEFHKRIGRSRIAERIHALNDQCKEGLAAMKHVKLYTPRGNKLSSGIIAFEVEGMRSEHVVKKMLEKRIVASTAPYKEGYARLAPSLLNTPEEIEATLRCIHAIA